MVGASRTSVSWIGHSDGAAYLFRRNATDPDRWDHVARLIVPGADQCVAGLSVSQFLLEATVEEQEAAAACANENRVDSGAFGHRVAIEGDTVLVTARFADDDDGSFSVGKAHVYRRDPGGTDLWPHVATLSPSLPSSGGYFGRALALAGGTALIGAPSTTVDTRARQGAAYLFERAAGGPEAWDEVARLVAQDGLSDSQFGSAVTLDGAARIVGAQGDGTFRGAIYIAAPEEPPAPAFEPSGELVDDGIVEHPAGVLLGAPEGALSGPLPVWIHEVPAPAEPLSSQSRPLSPFYNVGAITTTLAAGDAPFGVAIPVPDDADLAHPGIAILGSGNALLEGPEAGKHWSPVRGVHNAELGLFSAALPTLSTSGSTILLIEHPDLSPVPLPETEGASAARHRTSAFTATASPFEIIVMSRMREISNVTFRTPFRNRNYPVSKPHNE